MYICYVLQILTHLWSQSFASESTFVLSRSTEHRKASVQFDKLYYRIIRGERHTPSITHISRAEEWRTDEAQL